MPGSGPWAPDRSNLVAQQLVDGRLGAGPLVDTLDDHCTIKVWTRLAIGKRLAWHRAGDDDGIFRHFSLEDFAGGPVDDLGGLAEEHAHAEHGALANNYAF